MLFWLLAESIDVDEGNRFTRIALGLGAGESRLATEVHIFRVMHGERAEVLAFTTHADSGKMPGLILSMGAGELLLGPVTPITAGRQRGIENLRTGWMNPRGKPTSPIGEARRDAQNQDADHGKPDQGGSATTRLNLVSGRLFRRAQYRVRGAHRIYRWPIGS